MTHRIIPHMTSSRLRWLTDVASTAPCHRGAASATGVRGAAMACGFQGRAMGANGCALFLARRNDDGEITHVWAGIVGQDGIKPMTWYALDGAGQPVEPER